MYNNNINYARATQLFYHYFTITQKNRATAICRGSVKKYNHSYYLTTFTELVVPSV